MAEQNPQAHAKNSPIVPPEESKEHGCFDFMKRKEHNKTGEDIAMADLDAAKESKDEKHTLMDELQRTHSHSTSSSEEEVEEGRERKKKKKKGLKEEKISADKEGEHTIEIKCSENENSETAPPEEKKGFLEKIKEKLPGQHKKAEEDIQTPYSTSTDQKEKKGIIDKIKDKLPGHHKEE